MSRLTLLIFLLLAISITHAQYYRIRQFNRSRKRVSEEKCKFYREKIDALDKPYFPEVVGGHDAEEKEFPHMAALGFGERDDIKWLCGGTLISEKHILTAAHCLSNSQYGEVKFVKLGDIYLKRPLLEGGKILGVKKVIRHPEYKPPSKYHDIGILELTEPLEFSLNIRPACLYPYNDFMKDYVKATGWGLTDFGGSSTNSLQEVTLNIFSDEECKRAYKNSARILGSGISNDNQLCAGSKTESKDTCQGDSGGPLVRARSVEGLHYLVGVTSFGKSCGVANVPGVYTKVVYYIPWIEKIVWP